MIFISNGTDSVPVAINGLHKNAEDCPVWPIYKLKDSRMRMIDINSKKPYQPLYRMNIVKFHDITECDSMKKKTLLHLFVYKKTVTLQMWMNALSGVGEKKGWNAIKRSVM